MKLTDTMYINLKDDNMGEHMKDSIVIIGANSFQNRVILKAKEMGYITHVFAWKSGDIGEKTADYFYPISITEKEKILDQCRKIKPKAIVSIASDLAVITVNYIANELGLTCNNPTDSLICTNKYEMRKAFQAGGVKVPKFIEVGLDTPVNLDGFRMPVIVKPTDRSGSRGITKVLDKKEINSAIQNSVKDSFEKKAIIEEFIEGEEYSCECISYKGKHNFLTITKKYTTGAPHFIETGHIQPSGLSENVIEKVKEEVFKALDALNIKNGPSHSEFKIDKNGNIGIIEIGARMGGDCIGSDLVKISTGYDLLKLTIDVALGKEPILKKVCEPKIAVIKFIFNEEDIEKLENIKLNYPNAVYYVSEMSDFNHKIVDSSSRYGYYILQCNSEKELKEIEML